MNSFSSIAAASESELLEKARAIVPELRAARAEIDALGRTPPAIASRLKAEGFYSMTIPSVYGGAQVSLSTWRKVVSEIGCGDAGVAWGMSLVNSANWGVSGLFPKHVLDEVFATPEDCVAGILSPRAGKSRRVEGGFMVSGEWHFNSGVYHATWDLLGFPISDENGKMVGVGGALLPMKDVQLSHDWDPSGLRGSGSTNISVQEVFVPDERIVMMPAVLEGARPGAFGDDPIYMAAFQPVMAVILTFPMIGAGAHMLEEFIGRLPKRDIKGTSYSKSSEAPVTQMQIGRISSKLDIAKLVIGNVCETLEDWAARGEVMGFAERSRLCRDAAAADKMIWEAAELLADASGGTFSYNSNVLNRVWQDIKVGCAHPFVATNSYYENFGRILSGIEGRLMVV